MNIIIPASLRSLDNWLLYVVSDGRKIPFNPQTLWPANSMEAVASFDFIQDCLANTHAYSDWEPPVEGPRFDGIGIQLGGGVACVDLDQCRDLQTGEIEPGALTVIARLNSFTEISRSGQGIHIFCRTECPPQSRCRKGRIEIYSQKRWIAVTGHHLHGTPIDLEDRTLELLSLHREIFGDGDQVTPNEPVITRGSKSPLSDEQLLGLARTAMNGQRFRELFDGPVPPGDHSRQDFELVSKLLFWFGDDFDRVDRIFRQSALMRAKWLRADYRLRTMRNAALRVTERYTPTPQKEVAGAATGA